jgi:ribosome biogenesis protein UTP30
MAVKASTNSKATSFVKTNAVVDTSLDQDLVEKAVRAVLKYHEKITQESSEKKLSLLGDDRPVHVQFTLLRAPGHSKPKPVQIVVPHPFFKLADKTSDDQDEDEVEEPEICLIVKESSKPWCQEMIEKFPDHMGCVKKVLTLDSLRKKYTSYEQKRQLLHKYNMFMADDRILPMLSKSLGKAFIQTKRLPVPINLTREKALPFAIQKALSATYMTVNTGTCVTVRAGHTGMDPKKLVENITTIAEKAVPKMPRRWANIQLIGVKTADSVSLPVYNKTPEALREIAKLAGIKPDVGLNAGPSKREDMKHEETSEEAKAKKKRELKSPLLQALKKQKREEDEGKKAKKQEKEEPKKDDDDNLYNNEKSGNKRKSSDATEETPKQSKDVKVVEKEKKSKSKHNKKSEENPEPEEESPKKKQRKEEKKSTTKATQDDKKNNETDKQNFIAAKKFKGSKKGYVFRMGRQGVGYYEDKKPVVDTDAMEAILRIGKNQSRRGGQKKNKYKGTRRF